MNTVTLARHAMASRFELVIIGEDPARLRAAGEEALDEVDRIEARLSLYRSSSDIAQINAMAARGPVRVSPEVLALLKRAAQLHQDTGGAFDITVAPLVNAWSFMDGVWRCPDSAELERLRAVVGMRHLILDERNMTVAFDTPGVMVDLGAIGKGYAIEQAANILRDAGIQRALIHGGTSTVYAIGGPPEATSWRIAVESPETNAQTPGVGAEGQMRRLKSAAVLPADSSRNKQTLFSVELRDMAFSVSSPSGKCFEFEGQIFGHVIDPATAKPGKAGLLAAVMLPSATETDALSTALLLLGPSGRDRIRIGRPMLKAWFVDDAMRIVGDD